MGIKVRGSRNCTHRQRKPVFFVSFPQGVRGDGVGNNFTSTYHPHTDGETERHNRKSLEMLRCNVSDHQRYSDDQVQVLTYAHNSRVHSSTKHFPFQLVLSVTPSDPYLFSDEEETLKKAWKGK